MAERPSRRGPRHEKSINLALQGGGAHGAFTWGVLDRLFEDDRIWIESISGASAGSMNAVVAAQGMYENGAVGARARLETFWRAVSKAAAFSPIRRTPLATLISARWMCPHTTPSTPCLRAASATADSKLEMKLTAFLTLCFR